MQRLPGIADPSLLSRLPAAAGDLSSRARAGQNAIALLSGRDAAAKLRGAQALAAELGRSVHRIDSRVLTARYIGETEKNLARVLAAAGAEKAVLLFDEAPALFGKRTDIKDAHDRYADLETGYLLARLEAHPGLVLLVTQREGDLDFRVRRRLRAVIGFPP